MRAPYFERDGVALYHGDALAVLAELEDESVGVVATDPPYSSGARNAASIRSRPGLRRQTGPHARWFGSDNLTAHGFAMLVRLLGVEALRVTVQDGHLFSFIDWRQLPVLQGAIEAAGWSPSALLTWDKGAFGMGNRFRQQAEFVLHATKGVGDNFLRHDLGTVFRFPRPREDLVPTQKPEELAELLLSAVPGDVVLDPFAGSGTWLVAARAAGRRAIGIEIDEETCEKAARRLEQLPLPF